MKENYTHVQREVESSSPEPSIMDKEPKQKSIEIKPRPFHNDDTINAQLDNTSKTLVALQPISPLKSVIQQISEAKSSTLSNLSIRLKQNI